MDYVKRFSKKYRLSGEYQTNLMILKKNLLFNALEKSQFGFCPLVWMFCSRTSNNMINKVHEWALSLILGDDLRDFESLL